MNIRPDVSTPLSVEGTDQEYLLDPRYDFVRIFPKIAHAIINILTNEGVIRMHTTEAEARRIGLHACLPMIEMDWIGEQEWEVYLQCREQDLDGLDFEIE